MISQLVTVHSLATSSEREHQGTLHTGLFYFFVFLSTSKPDAVVLIIGTLRCVKDRKRRKEKVDITSQAQHPYVMSNLVNPENNVLSTKTHNSTKGA